MFKEVAEWGLCGQLYVDTHITPPSTLEGSAGTVELAATMQVSKNDELFIKNEELCVKNEEFCIKCRRWQRPW